MTRQGERAAADWKVADFARSWAEGDSMRNMLDFPRRIAAAIVAGDVPADKAEPGCVADVASGPGDMLAAFLSEFPSARGIWTDASEAMLDLARERLAPFGDRVEYHIADMTDITADIVPAGVDVITTSRAAHHLDRAGLAAFYRQAASLLGPGGWLVNLDHIGPEDVWDRRLRAARRRLGASPDGPAHHHNYPLTSVRDHLDGYAAAGITDVDVAWRAFYTCLFMGRRE
jgi:SAM-dependent methyltransferase